MGYKKHVLWIEDDAAFNLDYLASPLILNPRYDLTLAATISDALHFLRSRAEYDAIVFDLRVPPGNQVIWKALHQDLSQSKTPAQLGFHLLMGLLDLPHPMHRKHDLQINELVKKRVNVQTIGIMSVDVNSTILRELKRLDCDETETKQVLDQLVQRIKSDSFYKHKMVRMPNQALLTLVEAIVDGGGGDKWTMNNNTETPTAE